jgi:hypothetical protein
MRWLRFDVDGQNYTSVNVLGFKCQTLSTSNIVAIARHALLDGCAVRAMRENWNQVLTVASLVARN